MKLIIICMGLSILFQIIELSQTTRNQKIKEEKKTYKQTNSSNLA